MGKFVSKVMIPEKVELYQYKQWEPFIFAICYETIYQLAAEGFDCSKALLKRNVRGITGRTHVKVNESIDFCFEQGFLYEDSEGHVKYSYDAISKNGYVKVDSSILNWFAENSPNDSMSFRLYARLLHIYQYNKTQHRTWELRIGGQSKMSLLSQTGYYPIAAKNRNKATEIIQRFQDAGFVNVSSPHLKYSEMGNYCGKTRTLWEVKDRIEYNIDKDGQEGTEESHFQSNSLDKSEV